MEYQELTLQAVTIESKDIYLAMGYGDHLPDSYIRKMVAEIRQEIQSVCIPRYMYQIVDCTFNHPGRLKILTQEFTLGRIIGSYLPGISKSCLFVATAGREYEAYLHALKASGDVVKEFVADSIGSVIAEACVAEIGKQLDLNRELTHTLPYSPGYCGWHIREQKKLFSLFPDSPCGVTLTDSFLMAPVKSISGFFGLGKDLQPQPYRCEICKNTTCFKRRATQ